MKFSGKVGDEPLNKMVKFWRRSGSLSGYGDCFPDWEIRKVISGHESAAHTDSPDGGTGNTCLGGGMHCPNASSFSEFDYNGHVRIRSDIGACAITAEPIEMSFEIWTRVGPRNHVLDWGAH